MIDKKKFITFKFFATLFGFFAVCTVMAATFISDFNLSWDLSWQKLGLMISFLICILAAIFILLYTQVKRKINKLERNTHIIQGFIMGKRIQYYTGKDGNQVATYNIYLDGDVKFLNVTEEDYNTVFDGQKVEIHAMAKTREIIKILPATI